MADIFFRNKKTLLILTLFALITIVLYGRTINNPLQCDDFYLLGFEKNHLFGYPDQHLGELSQFKFFFNSLYPDYFRPLPLIFWWAQYNIFGYNEIPPHLLNLALLYSSVCILYFFQTRFGIGKLPAVVVSTLLLTSPITAGTVAWSSDSFDLFACFFILLSLLLYQSYLATGKKGPYVGALIATIGGLLSKETAIIILPLIFFMCLLFPSDLPGKNSTSNKRVTILKNTLINLFPYIIIFMSYFTIRYVLLGTLSTQEIPNMGCVYCGWYTTLRSLLIPLRGSVVWSGWFVYKIIVSVIFLSSLLLVILRWNKCPKNIRKVWILFVLFWFVALMPSWTLILSRGITYDLFVARYLFLTNLGFIAFTILGLYQFGWTRKLWRISLTFILVTICSMNLWVSYKTNLLWERSSYLSEYIATELKQQLPDPPYNSKIYLTRMDGEQYPFYWCEFFLEIEIRAKYNRHDLTILLDKEWKNDGYNFAFYEEAGQLRQVIRPASQ